MSSRDLNIVDRGIDGQAWSNERGKITAQELSVVGEQKTNSTAALNALPTPFARFFVVKEAFRRAREEYVSRRNKDTRQFKDAGYAYRQLVSDCLDVYELLFNLKHHRNNWKGKEIVIREWIMRDNMEKLKISAPKLHHSVNTYYGTDVNLDKLFFVVLREDGKEKLLATSSPWTGFITPPDLDKKIFKDRENTVHTQFTAEKYENLHLKRKGKGEYFFDTIMFEDRSPEFKNYMFNMLFGNSTLDSKLEEIRDYIKEFANDSDIKNNFKMKVVPVLSEDDNDVVVNGLSFYTSSERDVNKIFNDYIVKLPYRLSADNYLMPRMDNKDDRTYDYLLPLSEEALEVLDLRALDIVYKERANGSRIEVEVTDGDKKYQHVFEDTTMPAEGRGMIVDFAKEKFNIGLETALFPNFVSSKEEENNFFKLMVAVRDANKFPTINANDITCKFYVANEDGCGELLEETDVNNSDSLVSGTKIPVVRSVQDANSPCASVFFEVFNAVPVAYSLHLKIENKDIPCVLIPKFKKSNPNKGYVYTIDFGTTNTYISKREIGTSTEPLQLKMSETMMSYLHGITKSKKQLINLWEDVPFEESLPYFQSEFVPPFIDGEKYKFPLRTAICKTKKEKNLPILFDNRNIAFSYGKKKVVADHVVDTNIKWTEKADEKRLYIRELLMIVKADALQNDADLSKTQIIWFYPLSFNTNLMDRFKKFWEEEAKNILGIPANQITQYTESEAPYYYFAQKSVFKAISSVTVVDIGGGSTDMVYFENGVPRIANSVHFGCDVMWENAYDKMENSRRNGVFNYYKNQVAFVDNEDLAEVNEQMCKEGSTSTTRDIINFWISNSSRIKVGDNNFNELLKYDCKPLFLYHYAAIIYYMAKMYKENNLPCPRAICFSGNGSRYIDGNLTSNIDTLTEITMIVFSSIYGEDIQPIQIILPEYRKEATCYGGLYRDTSLEAPKTVVFQGSDNTQYESVEELTNAFKNGLRENVIKDVKELNSFFEKMLQVLMRRDDIDNVDITPIKDKLSEDVADSLDKNFHEEVVAKYASTMAYRDSIFFIPVIDNILTLTDINSYKK